VIRKNPVLAHRQSDPRLLIGHAVRAAAGIEGCEHLTNTIGNVEGEETAHPMIEGAVL
jgi:hypothetical protein